MVCNVSDGCGAAQGWWKLSALQISWSSLSLLVTGWTLGQPTNQLLLGRPDQSGPSVGGGEPMGGQSGRASTGLFTEQVLATV